MNNSISINSQIRFGAPCVAGTRISVSDILGYIAGGDSIETIVENFPELKKSSIVEAVSYASNMLNMGAKISSPYEVTVG